MRFMVKICVLLTKAGRGWMNEWWWFHACTHAHIRIVTEWEENENDWFTRRIDSPRCTYLHTHILHMHLTYPTHTHTYIYFSPYIHTYTHFLLTHTLYLDTPYPSCICLPSLYLFHPLQRTLLPSSLFHSRYYAAFPPKLKKEAR